MLVKVWLCIYIDVSTAEAFPEQRCTLWFLGRSPVMSIEMCVYVYDVDRAVVSQRRHMIMMLPFLS